MAFASKKDKGKRKPGKRRPKKVFRRKKCKFCVDKVDKIDYKDVIRIRKNLTERGKIIPRRITGNCSTHQRQLALSVKRARFIALIPYLTEH